MWWIFLLESLHIFHIAAASVCCHLRDSGGSPDKNINNSSFLCGSILYDCRWGGGVLKKSLPRHIIVRVTWLESHQALWLGTTQNSCSLCSILHTSYPWHKGQLLVWTTYFSGHKALYRDFVIRLNDLWRSFKLFKPHSGLNSGLMQLLLPFLIFICNFLFILYNKKKFPYWSCNLF